MRVMFKSPHLYRLWAQMRERSYWEFDHAFVVGMDDIAGIDRDASDFDRFIESAKSKSGMMDRLSPAVRGEGDIQQAFDIAHATICYEAYAPYGVGGLSHAIADDALMIRTGATGLHHPNDGQVDLGHLLQVLPVSIDIGNISRAAGVCVAGQRDTDGRSQRGRHRLDESAHIPLFRW